MATGQVTTHRNYVGGEWVDSVSGQTYPITSPASRHTVLGKFQASVPEDALKAVEAAEKALAGWASTPAPVRAGPRQRPNPGRGGASAIWRAEIIRCRTSRAGD